VLIAATRKEKVETVSRSRISPPQAAVMDVESFAQQAALPLWCRRCPRRQGPDIAVVDVGANVMNVTVLRNDQSVYTREQAFGGNQLTQEIVSRYGMSAEEAETAKRREACRMIFEPRCCGRSWRTCRRRCSARCQFFFTSTAVSRRRSHPARRGSAVFRGWTSGQSAHAGAEQRGEPLRRDADFLEGSAQAPDDRRAVAGRRLRLAMRRFDPQ